MQMLYESAAALTTSLLPDPICHYTDQRGFLGILESKCVWASDLRYLNDTEEHQVGYRKITTQLQALSAGEQRLQDLLWSILDPIRPENASGVGVTSFSAADDDLSQWRAYAGGSGGVALRLDSAELTKRILLTGSSLGACLYSHAAHERAVFAVCTDIIADARDVLAGRTAHDDFARRCHLSVQLTCALLKDAAFEAEREYRMIVWSRLPPYVLPSVRSGRSMMIPYYIVPLDLVPSASAPARVGRLPLREVRVGPTVHPQLAARAAAIALEIRGESCGVVHSAVPYRNW